MVEFALFVTWSACLLQDRSLLMVTPKYFDSAPGYGWCSLNKGDSFYL